MIEKEYLISNIFTILEKESKKLESTNETQYIKGKVFAITQITNTMRTYEKLIRTTLYTNSIRYSVLEHIIENLKNNITNIEETLKFSHVNINNTESFIEGCLDETNIIVRELEIFKNK